MLEKITNDGNGQYFFIDSRQEGSRVFGKELTGTLMTIAKDVKIQVEFNPREVQEYRLIGYSNRMLEAEDFNNDRIDAGEIGAGHTVTALYEVVPGRAIPEVDDLKYVSPPLVKPGQKVKKFKPLAQKAPEVLAELLTVKLRYKQPQGRKSKLLKQAVVDTETSFENASEDFQFASSVALFGMLLRDSEYLGAADPELVEQIAAETTKEQSEREEFIKLVQKWRGEQQPLQLDE